jgi:Mce-associated membrane protein
MADDAAAPSGELSKPATEPAEPAEQLDDNTVEPSGTEAPDEPDRTGDEAVGPDVSDDSAAESADHPTAAPRQPMSHVRLALIAGLVAVVALAGVCGWLGYRAYESNQLADQRQVFLQVGRQGALNLTTIDFQNVDADVTRILDSATGTFYDDFQQRSQPFAEVVRQVKSKSVGSVTAAGLEDVTPEGARVLVAVTVNTAVEGQPEQAPRAWRMRITVEQTADDVKVSNVEFVA